MFKQHFNIYSDDNIPQLLIQTHIQISILYVKHFIQSEIEFSLNDLALHHHSCFFTYTL